MPARRPGSCLRPGRFLPFHGAIGAKPSLEAGVPFSSTTVIERTFARKPGGEESGAAGSEGSESGWKSPRPASGPSPRASCPALGGRCRGASRPQGLGPTALSSLPGVALPPPSPGHGGRSSWTTVTLVRTMSRFDMAF